MLRVYLSRFFSPLEDVGPTTPKTRSLSYPLPSAFWAQRAEFLEFGIDGRRNGERFCTSSIPDSLVVTSILLWRTHVLREPLKLHLDSLCMAVDPCLISFGTADAGNNIWGFTFMQTFNLWARVHAGRSLQSSRGVPRLKPPTYIGQQKGP